MALPRPLVFRHFAAVTGLDRSGYRVDTLRTITETLGEHQGENTAYFRSSSVGTVLDRTTIARKSESRTKQEGPGCPGPSAGCALPRGISCGSCGPWP